MANRLYLEDIVKQKKIRIEEKKYDIEKLIAGISETKKRPSFYKALTKEGLSIIGEVKKASPSKGLIKPDFKPVEIAKEYEKAVDAISVLTEEDFFLGKDDYLKQISEQVTLPTLCKDFILDPNQIYSAKALGASAVLLITAILTERQLSDYLTIAHSVELDALVEVHNKSEVKRALSVGANIIGINNRDLKTFKTNIDTTIKLRKYIPDQIVTISESGINCVNDIKRLRAARIDGILVGESFMRSKDIYKHAREFKDAYRD